jgi:hypothetical protein
MENVHCRHHVYERAVEHPSIHGSLVMHNYHQSLLCGFMASSGAMKLDRRSKSIISDTGLTPDSISAVVTRPITRNALVVLLKDMIRMT